jgi:hypothetical protein
MPAALLVDVLTGRTRLATHLLTGRLHVEGEPAAGNALVWLIDDFPRQAGVQGLAARALSRWMAA